MLSALVERLGDGYANVRSAAAETLGRLGTSATPEVLSAGRASGWRRCERAIYGGRGVGPSGDIGGHAGSAQGAVGRLGGEDANVRSAAAEALGSLGASAATPEVLSARSVRWATKGANVRFAAARALGRLEASAATPEVLSAGPAPG